MKVADNPSGPSASEPLHSFNNPQARIGASAMAALAEKPELTGRAILMVAIPETMVILGFAVAAMIIVLL